MKYSSSVYVWFFYGCTYLITFHFWLNCFRHFHCYSLLFLWKNNIFESTNYFFLLDRQALILKKLGSREKKTPNLFVPGLSSMRIRCLLYGIVNLYDVVAFFGFTFFNYVLFSFSCQNISNTNHKSLYC